MVDNKRSDPDLRRHQPHQTPRQRFFQRPAVKHLLLRAVQRHHPTRVIDGPRILAATHGDGGAQRVLERPPIEGGYEPPSSASWQ